MKPTHILKLADGYGETECEVLSTRDGLVSVRVRCNAYWERDRYEVRVVRASSLRLIDREAA